MSLPLEGIRPTTVNVALDLRTSVRLLPYDAGWVKISSDGFPRGQAFPLKALPFTPPFGIFFGAVGLFGFDGLHVRVASRSPVKSALGGSSTALVALVKALGLLSHRMGRESVSRTQVLHLSYHIEDALSGGGCGMQDQGAAVYGGVSQWLWRYSRRENPVARVPLLGLTAQESLSGRLLVAYSGRGHVSHQVNRRWLEGFRSGKTRAGWIRANGVVHEFASALKEMRWQEAAELLREETRIRAEITPEALTPVTAQLVKAAGKAKCGARFAGAGAGGCAWALGEEENIDRLRDLWGRTLRAVPGAKILDCRVDPQGVREDMG
jgi:D-glycero-alpha-D-manno-heptose-7-phosphate kinase